MRVLICDDHRVFADSLAFVLTGHDCTATAVYRVAEALAAVERQRFDVCVMDLRFPDGDGVAAVRAMVRRREPPVVVLSASTTEDALVAQALDAGASAVVRKGAHLSELIDAITTVGRGAPANASHGVVTAAPGSRGRMRPGWSLTDREREVLSRLVAGESGPALARAMGVSYSTARSHIHHVLTKLGVHSQLEAVALAVQEGLVDLPPRRASGLPPSA